MIATAYKIPDKIPISSPVPSAILPPSSVRNPIPVIEIRTPATLYFAGSLRKSTASKIGTNTIAIFSKKDDVDEAVSRSVKSSAVITQKKASPTSNPFSRVCFLIFTSLFPNGIQRSRNASKNLTPSRLNGFIAFIVTFDITKDVLLATSTRISKISAPRSVFMPSNFFICFSAPYIFCLFILLRSLPLWYTRFRHSQVFYHSCQVLSRISRLHL